MNANTTITAPAATQAPASSIVRLQGVSKIYGSGDAQVRALDDVSVGFGAGEFTAIMGPSGSGKSTMMHILAGLDAPTSGRVFVEDTDITALKDTALTKLRRDRIGFVFQSFNLVPTLDARANILLPMRLAGKAPEKEWFDLIANSLGIANRLSHRPSEMSGGQQQRVAVARALMSRPAVIVADEPTGNLDSHSTDEVMDLLRRAVDELEPERHHGHPRHRDCRLRGPRPRVPRRPHRLRPARHHRRQPDRGAALNARPHPKAHLMSATNSLLSANLRSHGRRYISTGLAVAISTAFIVITLIVMTAMTSGLTSSVYSQYRGGTIVVSQNDDAPEGAIENAEKTLSATSGVTAIKHMAQWPADAQTDTTRAGLYVSPMAPKPFAGLDLSAGTAPTADDEIVIPEHTALTLSLKVGDTVRVRAGFAEGDTAPSPLSAPRTRTPSAWECPPAT